MYFTDYINKKLSGLMYRNCNESSYYSYNVSKKNFNTSGLDIYMTSKVTKLNPSFVPIQTPITIIMFLLYFMLMTIFVVAINESKFSFFLKKITLIGQENMMLMKDYTLFLFLFIGAVLNLFFSPYKYLYSFNMGYYFILINILLLVSVVLQLPLIFLVNTGSTAILTLKGFVGKTSKFRTLLEDIFSSSTFIFRYFLQSMRWLLVSVSIFLVSETFFDTLSISKLFSFNVNPDLSNSVLSLTNILLTLTKYLIEYLDLLFMISIQLSAFGVLLFWLFSFIFSTTVANFYENLN